MTRNYSEHAAATNGGSPELEQLSFLAPTSSTTPAATSAVHGSLGMVRPRPDTLLVALELGLVLHVVSLLQGVPQLSHRLWHVRHLVLCCGRSRTEKRYHRKFFKFFSNSPARRLKIQIQIK